MRWVRGPRNSVASERLLGTFRLVAGAYAGLVLFSTWVLALLAGPQSSTTAKLVLPIAVCIVVSSAWLKPDTVAWAVSLTGLWVPYILLVWFPAPGQTSWLPFGLFTSVVVIVSAVTSVTWLGALLVVVFAVLQFLQLSDPAGHLRIAASFVHGFPILLTYQVAVAIGVLLAYRASVRHTRQLDARNTYLEQLAAAESTLEKQRAERLRATQRLHETVLNTLRAVGRQTDGQAPELAERCADDLVVLEDWQYDSRPHTIREVIDASLRSVDLGPVAVRIREDRDLTLNAETSDAIRSMLSELLLNVARHAGAANVVVGWSVLDDMRLVFTVEDDGVGIPDKASGRLGIRRIVTATAASLDGQVLLNERPGGGTVVTLRIRLRAPGIDRPIGRFDVDLPREILKIMGQTSLLWSLVISPIVVIDLERPFLVGVISMMAAAILFFAITLRTTPPPWVFVLGVGLAAGNLLLANAFSNSCTSSSSIQWLTNMLIVDAMVTIIFGTPWVRIYTVLISLVAPLLVVFDLPSQCAEYVWLPLVSMVTLILPTVVFARSRTTLVQPNNDQSRLDTLLTEQLRRERQADDRRLRWAAALERSRVVMADIAYSGNVDAGLRQRAEVADAQLRGQLLIEPAEDGALASFALELVDSSAERGVALKAEVLDVSRRTDPLPEAALTEVRQLVSLAKGEAQLKLFVVGDEESMTLIVPIVPGSMPYFSDGSVAEGFVERTHGDLRLEFDPQDVDEQGLLPVWVSISRSVK